MSTFRNNISEILRCLRPSNEARNPLLSRPSWIPSTKTLFQSTRDMSLSNLWRGRLTTVAGSVLEFGWVVVVYLTSELTIWGLSRALTLANLDFFSSIFGMVLTFCFMVVAFFCFAGVDDIYQRHIKSKVDFINVHLGLGFPIPLVMLNQSDILGGRDIACIIGNFVITNLASWVVVFILSLLVMSGAASMNAQVPDDFYLPRPLTSEPPRIETSWLSDSTLDQVSQPIFAGRGKLATQATPRREEPASPAPSQRSSIILKDPVDTSWAWHLCTSNFPLLASCFGIFVIGAPVAAIADEDRILDG
ncbi:hypothetical protein FHETE_11169, partial [Fusarium heterosporum]